MKTWLHRIIQVHSRDLKWLSYSHQALALCSDLQMYFNISISLTVWKQPPNLTLAKNNYYYCFVFFLNNVGIDQLLGLISKKNPKTLTQSGTIFCICWFERQLLPLRDNAVFSQSILSSTALQHGKENVKQNIGTDKPGLNHSNTNNIKLDQFKLCTVSLSSSVQLSKVKTTAEHTLRELKY